jgi:hypothetical protein
VLDVYRPIIDNESMTLIILEETATPRIKLEKMEKWWNRYAREP